MSLAQSNAVLRQILEFLMEQMGRSNLLVRFEDFSMPEEDEPFFDGMVVWALREGLISLQSSENLMNAHTEHSYSRLQSPAITSFGLAVYAYATEQVRGNILQATALMKNAEHFGGKSGGSGGSGGGSLARLSGGAAGLRTRIPMQVRVPGEMHLMQIEHEPAPPRPGQG